MSRLLPWLTALLCVTATGLAGIVGGIAVATRLLSTSTMGVDQLASALGGFAVGGLAGLLLGIALTRWLTPGRRAAVALLAFLASVILMWYLQSTRPVPDPSGPRTVQLKPTLA